MSSTQNDLEFVLDLLSEAPDVTHQKMMGEYLLHSNDILFGGIFDDAKPMTVVVSNNCVAVKNVTIIREIPEMLYFSIDARPQIAK